MTVASLRLGRPVPLSAHEFNMWRARDRAMLLMDKQARMRREVLLAVRNGRRSGR